MDTILEPGGHEQGSKTAQLVLRNAQLLYPVVLLLSFIVSAGIHTIITSKTEEELAGPTITGPGGKPLPVNKRKREQQPRDSDDDAGAGGGLVWTIFLYLTGGIVMSFVANGAAVAAHAMKSSSDAGLDNAWWCGEERTVSFCLPPSSRPRL